ncbi:hypothetical protein A5634_04145 [Mycobacterium asiaticum]|uniref:Winged helix-turn-helix domain-containing protein n=1 Tax=Mycobacterium asiaticum TaxID=1790 RepID=A0A1A3NS37_MYCAS|nr:hypothetical protein A5634_04145 [Mycobacterium asiaticum]
MEGEQIIAVAPLSVGDAMRLFGERARASAPGFVLDAQPVGAVAEICRRVDCLPLGVELAAARMRVMSVSDVARRLDRLGFLRGAMRGALPRQQSLTATIDWSYRLLSESEQVFFARLSVFAGSFDLAAAHGVCGVVGSAEDDTLEVLAGLVDKSMVVVRSMTDHTRYGVLETLRAYGQERLQDNGIDAEFETRHAVYYTELAERAGAGMHGPQEQEWVQRVLPDYDNLRAAFESVLADGRFELGMRLVTSVAELIGLRIGYEVAQWADRLIAVADPQHPLFVAVVGTAARGAWNGGDPERARSLVELADGRIPGRGAGRVCYPADVAADMSLFNDPDRAVAHWEAEAERARREDDPIRLVQALSALAYSQGLRGRPEVALPVAKEAVQVADTTANPTARSMAYFSLGFLLKKSEPVRATALFDRAASLAGAVQNFWWYGIALMEGAATRASRSEPKECPEAARMLVAVHDHWERVGDWVEQWVALRYTTRFLARLGAADDALFLHRVIVDAGHPPPLRPDQLDVLVDGSGTERFDAGEPTRASAGGGGTVAVARARSSLQRYLAETADSAT